MSSLLSLTSLSLSSSSTTTTTSSSSSSFPTILQRKDLMTYLGTNPEILILQWIVQFPRYTTSSSTKSSNTNNDYTLYDFIQGLQSKSSKIRIIYCNRHFTTGFDDTEWNQILYAFGNMINLEELYFIDSGDSRLRRIHLDTITNGILLRTQTKSPTKSHQRRPSLSKLRKLYFDKYWLLIGNEYDRIEFAKALRCNNTTNLQEFHYIGCHKASIYQSISSRQNPDRLLLSCTKFQALSITSYPYHTMDYSSYCIDEFLLRSKLYLRQLYLATCQWSTIADSIQRYSPAPVTTTTKTNIDANTIPNTTQQQENSTNDEEWKTVSYFVLEILSLIDYNSLITPITLRRMIEVSINKLPNLKHLKLYCYYGFTNPTDCITTLQNTLLFTPSINSIGRNNSNLRSITLADERFVQNPTDQEGVTTTTNNNNNNNNNNNASNAFTTNDIQRVAWIVRDCPYPRLRIVMNCSYHHDDDDDTNTSNNNTNDERISVATGSKAATTIMDGSTPSRRSFQAVFDELLIENILSTVGRYHHPDTVGSYLDTSSSQQPNLYESNNDDDHNDQERCHQHYYLYRWYTALAKVNWYLNYPSITKGCCQTIPTTSIPNLNNTPASSTQRCTCYMDFINPLYQSPPTSFIDPTIIQDHPTTTNNNQRTLKQQQIIKSFVGEDDNDSDDNNSSTTSVYFDSDNDLSVSADDGKHNADGNNYPDNLNNERNDDDSEASKLDPTLFFLHDDNDEEDIKFLSSIITTSTKTTVAKTGIIQQSCLYHLIRMNAGNIVPNNFKEEEKRVF